MALRQAFRRQVVRKQRRSDATLSLAGGRFEIPNRYRTLEKITVHYARWDLSHVDMVDSQSYALLATLYPLDKSANANEHRRVLQQDSTITAEATNTEDQNTIPTKEEGYPPLLTKLIENHAATGKPPAYLPQQKNGSSEKPLPDNQHQENIE
jgi:ABC-type transporter Mla MlaB component